MNVHRIITDLRRLCFLGFDAQLIIPPLLRMLHDLIPSRSNMFAWIDQNFELSNLYAEEAIPPEIIHHYLSEFYNQREAEVCLQFSQAARLERGITDWEQYFENEQLLRSDFYKQIMLPQHVRYLLRAYIAIDGRNVGLLILQRHPSDMPFSKLDQSLLTRIIPYINNALKAPTRYPNSFGTAWKTGLMLLNQHGDPVSTDTFGQQLLLLAGNAKINARTINQTQHSNIRHMLKELCARNLSLLPDCSYTGTAIQMQNEWGVFSINTYPLNQTKLSEPVLGVTISQHLPQQIMLIQSMKKSPLSGKQKEVCLWLLEGCSQQDIALKMGISPHSVNDYLKSAYRKLEVHSKDQLLRKLLSEAA
jgi:DNA-binding CsgD family transcriptional regulator